MRDEQARVVRWDDLVREPMRGGITRRFVHSDKLMLAQITLQAGDVVPPHRHHNEQFTYVISGLMHFTFGDAQDKHVSVGPGEVLLIPSGLLHSASVSEDTFELDIFDPPRADWIDGSDAYLRGEEAAVTGSVGGAS